MFLVFGGIPFLSTFLGSAAFGTLNITSMRCCLFGSVLAALMVYTLLTGLAIFHGFARFLAATFPRPDSLGKGQNAANNSHTQITIQ